VDLPERQETWTHLTKLNNSHARALEDTGLQFVIYDFRDTAATRWAEHGMPLAKLAKILGHSNLRSVTKYVHPSQEHMDEAMLRFGEPEKEVSFGSVPGVNQGDFTGLDVIERETLDNAYLNDKKGKIQ
jgi:hypothetical protein